MTITTEFALARFTNLNQEEVQHFAEYIRIVPKTAIGYNGYVRPECQYEVFMGIVKVEPGVGILVWINSHASGPVVCLAGKANFTTVGNFHRGDKEAVEQSILETCKDWEITTLIKFGGDCMFGPNDGSYEGLNVMGYYGKDNSFVEACSRGYRFFEWIDNPYDHTMRSRCRVMIPGPGSS